MLFTILSIVRQFGHGLCCTAASGPASAGFRAAGLYPSCWRSLAIQLLASGQAPGISGLTFITSAGGLRGALSLHVWLFLFYKSVLSLATRDYTIPRLIHLFHSIGVDDVLTFFHLAAAVHAVTMATTDTKLRVNYTEADLNGI